MWLLQFRVLEQLLKYLQRQLRHELHHRVLLSHIPVCHQPLQFKHTSIVWERGARRMSAFIELLNQTSVTQPKKEGSTVRSVGLEKHTEYFKAATVHERASRSLLNCINWSIHKLWNVFNPNCLTCLPDLQLWLNHISTLGRRKNDPPCTHLPDLQVQSSHISTIGKKEKKIQSPMYPSPCMCSLSLQIHQIIMLTMSRHFFWK